MQAHAGQSLIIDAAEDAANAGAAAAAAVVAATAAVPVQDSTVPPVRKQCPCPNNAKSCFRNFWSLWKWRFRCLVLGDGLGFSVILGVGMVMFHRFCLLRFVSSVLQLRGLHRHECLDVNDVPSPFTACVFRGRT